MALRIPRTHVGALVFAAAATLLAASSAQAVSIAVFGDNATDNFINTTFGAGSATLVSDAQIATPGFLNSFDAFYYTRDGFSFGASLSPAAAAQVQSFVTGNVVLLAGDYADGIGQPSVNQLTINAVNTATSGGKGYIGELIGAYAALTANGNGWTPLGFVSGSADAVNFPIGDGNILQAQASPILAGLTFPFDPTDVEFAANVTGVSSSLIVATYENSGAPAIITTAVPEPTMLAPLAVGMILALRRKA